MAPPPAASAGGRRSSVGALDGGFVMPTLRVLTDHEIFRRARRLRAAAPLPPGGALGGHRRAHAEGDYVVHLDHGIGIYRGIDHDHGGRRHPRGRDGGVRGRRPAQRPAVPARPARALPRRRRGWRRPPPRLHRLGGRSWQRVRERTRAGHQADGRRAARPLRPAHGERRAIAFPPDTRWQRELESSFLYEDTPDQRKATEEVKGDMERPRPMDRLLVGDVGYGKTEVAVRAAFKAVQGGKQVAVLVPTTILAEQHGRTFPERLGRLSRSRSRCCRRFRTAKEQKTALDRLAAGQIDIVIGTHRLLSKDVDVQGPRPAHRGRGAPLRREAQGAAEGAPAIGGRAHPHRDADSPHAAPVALGAPRSHADRDPAARPSPILTFVEPWDDALLEEAFAREIDRGGQVFVVHNRIETIETIAARVRALAPRARVGGGARADGRPTSSRRSCAGSWPARWTSSSPP